MTRWIILLVLCSLALSACESSNSPFLVGDREERRELDRLIEQLEGQDRAPETRFIINNQIINVYFAHEAYQKMNLFLTTYVKKHPDDLYNAYYLLLVAENYRSAGALPFAVLYFERVLKNYGDLLLEGDRSVHYICLENLVTMVDNPAIRVGYYKELLERFLEKIDKGSNYYNLAVTYEQLGKWDLAMQHYREYLQYPETNGSSTLHSREEVSSMVAFYDMPKKNWTMENLEELVTMIRNAIRTRNTRRLNELRSGVDFFVKAWEDEETEQKLQELELLDDLGIFFDLGKTVRSSSTLDLGSNDKEAYLRTTGWGYRIPTWFFYFRMVDFPPDPDIHVEWEWAGIYLGEKPY